MTARQILARNLEALIDSAGWTLDATESKTGVSKRHLMNIKKDSKAASLDMVQKLADSFGLEPWQLLHPDNGNQDPGFKELLSHYLSADEEGRQLILLVARREQG